MKIGTRTTCTADLGYPAGNWISGNLQQYKSAFSKHVFSSAIHRGWPNSISWKASNARFCGKARSICFKHNSSVYAHLQPQWISVWWPRTREVAGLYPVAIVQPYLKVNQVQSQLPLNHEPLYHLIIKQPLYSHCCHQTLWIPEPLYHFIMIIAILPP